MNSKNAFSIALLSACLLSGIPSLSQSISSCTVVFVTPDCDGCDNKDHDTKIRVKVFNSHGHEAANAYYTEDKEFPDDGSENAVECTVTNSSGSGAAFAQKIIVTIEPNGMMTGGFQRM